MASCSDRKSSASLDVDSATLSDDGKKDNTSLLSTTHSMLTRKESYKAQRKNYRKEKKRAAKELVSQLQDPSIILLADWLKVRGCLKGWTKLWCVLKPGVLLLYKTSKAKSSGWVGTIILSTCELVERPSKKDGFCFKMFHPLEQSIWATRGPQGETIPAVVQPLPNTHLIFRATSADSGKCWMDSLELALQCSSLLMRSMTHHHPPTSLQTESDIEKHFPEHEMEDTASHTDAHLSLGEDEHTDTDSENGGTWHCEPEKPEETPYEPNETEEMGTIGSNADQMEELEEESKSILWFLLKQVRPGMDLSKVVLPTFILEPRSFLDKLSDYYYHADLLSRAVTDDNPKERMKAVVRWYLSGFYKKPKGLKKPYNPIIGETFRCYWEHPSGSKTFYIAEQVSHHPPISSFYVTNRQEGFTVSGSILAKSKFHGNSTSAILEGVACLALLTRGEEYLLTMPYAHCKGIVLGTLSMELGGKITISCSKTRYVTEIEFKLRPFLGSSEVTNLISGKLNFEKETIGTIHGHWDGEVTYLEKKTGETELLWNPSAEMRAQRLKRSTVPMEHQGEFESERLWKHVSAAIRQSNQVLATEEKTKLEEAQRASAKDRKTRNTEWIPKHFSLDLLTEKWVYKHFDPRPWDHNNDVMQYEKDYEIRTLTRLKTAMPLVRASSLLSNESQEGIVVGPGGPHPESGSSSADGEAESGFSTCRRTLSNQDSNIPLILKNIESLTEQQTHLLLRLETVSRNTDVMAHRWGRNQETSHYLHDWLKYLFMFLVHVLVVWFLQPSRTTKDTPPPP